MTDRILFNHIPKCAGSTVTDWLKESYPLEEQSHTDCWDLRPSIERWKRQTQRERHAPRLITGHESIKLLPYAHPEMNPITTVRHPVGRTISLFYFYRQQGKRFGDDMNFDKFIRVGWAENYYSYLGGAEGMRNTFALIGFQENLNPFAREAKARFGLKTEIRKRRLNAVAHPRVIDLPKQTIQALRKILEADIADYEAMRSQATSGFLSW